MTTQRRIEVFNAGCPVCDAAIAQIRAAACPSCDITIGDMNDPATARRAERLGVRSVPAVAIDVQLVDCCAGRSPDSDVLRSAGLGQPIA